MRKLIIAVCLVLFFPFSAVATTHFTDGSYDQVAAEMADAGTVAGDTITMPAGTFDWGSNTLTFNKNVTLQGNGLASTIITSTTGTLINITSADAGGCRITGFRVNKSSGYSIYINGVPVVGFRFDHLYLNYPTSTPAIEISYGASIKTVRSQGLIDNCTLINAKISYYQTCSNRYDWQTFADARNMGGSDAIYVEDCTITMNNPELNTGNIFDADCGASIVGRYNIINGRGVETHGIQDTHIYRPTMKIEVYRNKMDGTIGALKMAQPIYTRASSPMVWQNIIVDYNTCTFQLTDYHYTTGDIEGGLGPCDGTEPHDSNYGILGSDGWLCMDQPGAGPDKALRTVANPYPDQTQEPIYIFGNTCDGVASNVVTTGDENICKADRDYFRQGGTIGVSSGLLANIPATCKEGQGYWCTDCGSWNTANSTVVTDWTTADQGVLYRCDLVGSYYDGEDGISWSIYYTPYTYPHPLRGEGTTPSVQGCTISGGTFK